MSPTSYRAAPPRGDPRTLPEGFSRVKVTRRKSRVGHSGASRVTSHERRARSRAMTRRIFWHRLCGDAGAMRPRAQLTVAARAHLPLARLALCLDCEVCFEIGPEKCPACGSTTRSPLSRFIGDTSDKAVVKAVEALVEEARGISATRDGAQHLLIVSRTQPKLYEMLRRELAD